MHQLAREKGDMSNITWSNNQAMLKPTCKAKPKSGGKELMVNRPTMVAPHYIRASRCGNGM